MLHKLTVLRKKSLMNTAHFIFGVISRAAFFGSILPVRVLQKLHVWWPWTAALQREGSPSREAWLPNPLPASKCSQTCSSGDKTQSLCRLDLTHGLQVANPWSKAYLLLFGGRISWTAFFLLSPFSSSTWWEVCLLCRCRKPSFTENALADP